MAIASGLRNVVVGGFILGVGVLITMSSAADGKPRVYIAAILFGGAQFLRGIYQVIFATTAGGQAALPTQACDDMLERAFEMERLGDIDNALNVYDNLSAMPGYPSAIVARQRGAELRSQLVAR